MSKTPGGGLAHPRSRGEHLDSLVACLHQVGSSPLARGTPRTKSAVHSKVRLIPARAGNMHASTKPAASCPAHPRSREESSMLIGSACGRTGSSPLALARGTFAQILKALRLARLIPARAGNTCHVRAPRAHAWAHPRLRGEHNNHQSAPPSP